MNSPKTGFTICYGLIFSLFIICNSGIYPNPVFWLIFMLLTFNKRSFYEYWM